MAEQSKAIEKVESQAPAIQPRQVIAQGREMAEALMEVVEQADLAVDMGKGNRHLRIEAWQTIAKFARATSRIEWVKPITYKEKIIGYEAKASILDSDGNVLASAEAMCAKDEPRWKNKPLYAIKSMAQTRAVAKASRLAFAWVVVLAGFNPTPLEEVEDLGPELSQAGTSGSKTGKGSSGKEKPSTGDSGASGKEKWFYDFLKAVKPLKEKVIELYGDDDPYYTVLKAHGLEKANQVEDQETARKVYKALCDLLDKGEPIEGEVVEGEDG